MDLEFFLNVGLSSLLLALVSGSVFSAIFNHIYIMKMAEIHNQTQQPYTKEGIRQAIASKHPFVAWVYHLPLVKFYGGLFIVIVLLHLAANAAFLWAVGAL